MNSLAPRIACGLFLLWTGAGAVAYKPEIGEKPEEVQGIEYVDGSPVSLQALRGKPVVLYFGGDWCAPCIEKGRPATAAVARKYGTLGLQVVFVSMDDNNLRPEKLRESQKLGMAIAMPTLTLCPTGSCYHGIKDLGDGFGRLYVFPTAIVLDANGAVRAKLERGSGVEGGLEGAVERVMNQAGLLKPR